MLINNIKGTHYNKAYAVLTDNNFHTDTSILDCYIALGIVPPTATEQHELWGILHTLKIIERNSYDRGCITIEEIEQRNRCDKRIQEIVNKYGEV